MASQISLHVKVTIDPSNVDQFLEHCKPVVGAVTAEPECTYFEIFQDPTNPGSLKYIENWSASIDWLQNVQLQKAYYKPCLEAIEPMFIRPREVEIWNRMPPAQWTRAKDENFE